MLEKLTTQTAYKILAVSGLLIVALAPYVGWKYLASLESEAISVFESSILNRLDLESTQQQRLSLENAIAISRQQPDHPDAVDYSAAELKLLQAESDNLSARIKLLTDEHSELEVAKQSLINTTRIAFVTIFAVMLIAMLLTFLGVLGWYFHVRIYQERRSIPGTEKHRVLFSRPISQTLSWQVRLTTQTL